jgi:TRAP-type uncharacterized transport system fused permease subunit
VLAVGSLAVTTGAWLFGPARLPERILCAAAGLLLLYLEPFWVGVGVGVLVLGIVVHLVGARVAGEETTATGATASPGRSVGEAEKLD